MSFNYTFQTFFETYDEAYYWGEKSGKEFYIVDHPDNRRNHFELRFY